MADRLNSNEDLKVAESRTKCNTDELPEGASLFSSHQENSDGLGVEPLKGDLQPRAICYTYQQLPIHIATASPGSIFNQREQHCITKGESIMTYETTNLAIPANKVREHVSGAGWSTKFTQTILLIAAVGAPITAPTIAQAAAPLKWAVSNGTALSRGSLTTGFTHFGPGRYEVTFNSSVAGCAYVASTQASATQALTVFTAGGHISANGVYVETKNQGGGLSDAPFHLFVSCDATGAPERHAVIGYAADLIRASAGTTFASLGAGRYKVHFNRNVTSCAYLATVGDPASNLVFSPSGVYTSSDPNDVNGVYVETKNPGGGLQPGVPFHLAVVCPAPNFRIAVLRADGTPQRASALTSGFSGSVGRYTVATDRNITQCAWLSTRGEAGTAVPFTPTTVEVRPGSVFNIVNIEERNLLFFLGGFTRQALHFVAAC